jgi:predicted DNA-binding transcriptional regulator YafY
VTVRAPAEEVAARLPWLAGALEPIDARSCEYRTSDDDLEWLAIRVAMLGADIEVHKPRELIAQLELLAARLWRAASHRSPVHEAGQAAPGLSPGAADR